jgi:hypothetical protein
VPASLADVIAAAEPVARICPRCGETRSEVFYGPCGDCRAQLRSEQGGVARDVEVAEYEPKMNVTPNAVALKD